MKFKTLLFTLLASTTAFATSIQRPLTVKVTDEAQQVRISFETIEGKSSMCFFTNTALDLALPDNGPTFPILGRISLKASVIPGTPCLHAFGPHSGGLTLQKGYTLPELAQGDYALEINGIPYGVLQIDAAGRAKLIQ